jgi:tetratricopeptide (TPR) repeat protein
MATAQAAEEPQLGFPSKGSLRRFPFPRLVREVARANLTGSLYLLSGATKKVVFFEHGQPVFVRSNVLSECLGQVLAQEGLITQEQCEQTLEAIRRTGKKQGELLVEMGILSEGNLRYGLQAQLRTKLFDIFSWEEGRYQFKSDAPNQVFGVRLDASAEGVILAAIQEVYSEERARASLRPYDDQYPILRSGLPERGLELLPEEQHYALCLDGSRSVRHLMQTPAEVPVPTPAALLFGLIQAGIIHVAGEPQPARAAPPPPNRPGLLRGDDELAPAFEAQDVVTEYEDTPLPGELPKVRGLLGDHEADFAGVEDEEGPASGPTMHSSSAPRPKPPEALVAAEPSGVEEFEEAAFSGLMDEEGSSSSSLQLSPPPSSSSSASAGSGAASASSPDSVSSAGWESSTPSAASPRAATPSSSSSSAPRGSTPSAPALDPSPPSPLPFEAKPAVFDVDPIDIDTVADNSQVRAAMQLDAGEVYESEPARFERFEEQLPPISTDNIGEDLLGADELDDIDLGEPRRIDDFASDTTALDFGTAGHDLEPEDLGIEPPSIEADLDEADLDELELVEETDGAPVEVARSEDLVDFDELDNIDLDRGPGPAWPPELAPVPFPGETPSYSGPESTMEEDQSPEMIGAMRFNEAEAALGAADYDQAVALLEDAYENGFDVAELHAMLAYARFMAAGEDPDTAQHALELLDYAQQMDPSLDLVHAYRGAIYRALHQPQRAREALDRALELNPYCELAMQIMDSL